MLIPFGGYAGQNTGILTAELSGPSFRERAQATFGTSGTATTGKTDAAWVAPKQVDAVITFASEVTNAYRAR